MSKAYRGKRLEERSIRMRKVAKKAAKTANHFDGTETPAEERACLRKRFIPNETRAIEAGRWLLNNKFKGTNLYYYKCRHCKGFHFTSKPGRGSIEIKQKELS